MLQGCRLLKWSFEPTCKALCCRGAGCSSGVRTYLPGTVLQGCRLFKRCWNLPAGHGVAGVQAVKAMSEPTCRVLCAGVKAVSAVSEPISRALCCGSAGCLSGGIIYLLGTVLQGYRLFEQCQNLPAGQSVAGVQAAEAVLEPTCRALCCSGAGW